MIWEPRGKGRERWASPNAGDTPVVIRRLGIDGRAGFVDYQFAGVRWVWVSLTNYLTAAPERVAESILFRWPDTPELPDATPLHHRTARDRACLWMAVFCHMSDWWQTAAKAPLGLTAGQCAVGILRSHVGRGSICTHTHADAAELERAASFGGRASVWYYGDVGRPADHHTAECPAPAPSPFGSVPGPAVNLDVRSMYPNLLATERFPVALIGHRHRCPASEPQALARGLGVVARVRIRADVPSFPVRRGDRIVYPVGTFWTTLTGPELLRLRGRGRVLACEGIAVYRLGTPFRDAAAALLAMRADARSANRPAWELFVKLVSNSLAGKLAQRSGRWVERRRLTGPVPWGEWVEGGGPGGATRRFRALAGLVWEWDHEQGKPGPFAAAFAYLTALGRIRLENIRDRLGRKAVYAQDTDGLWVAPADVDVLRRSGEPFGDEPGNVSVRDVVESARWYGARHYWTPGRWVMAGIHAPVVSPDGSRVTDTFVPNPLRRATHGPPTTVSVKGRNCVIAVQPGPGRIGPDGWQEPPTFG